MKTTEAHAQFCKDFIEAMNSRKIETLSERASFEPAGPAKVVAAVATGSKGEPQVTEDDLNAATEWIVNRPHNVSRQIDSLALAFAKNRMAHTEPSNAEMCHEPKAVIKTQ